MLGGAVFNSRKQLNLGFDHSMDPVGEKIVRGGVTLPGDSELVTDADEEVRMLHPSGSRHGLILQPSQVFVLYSNLQINDGSNPTSSRGLGYVDSRKDTLTVTFELTGKPPTESDQPGPTPTSATRRSRHGRNSKTPKAEKIGSHTVEIELAQDKTALRTRKGDTGSVLWKARFASTSPYSCSEFPTH